MSNISLLAKLAVAEDKLDQLQDRLDALIEAAAEEEGLLVYSAHQEADDPTTVWFFEIYQDQAAYDVHGKGDRMRAAMGALGGLLAGRPEVTILNPLAAKGL